MSGMPKKIRRSAYGDVIMEAVECRPEDTFQIEEVMRSHHSTMCHLTRPYLHNLAREAWAAVQEMRVTDPDLFPMPEYAGDENGPAVRFTVFGRRTRATLEAEEEQHDTFEDAKTAGEFAKELVEYSGYYDARVINAKGVAVYSARRSGVRYNPKLGGKRRRKAKA